MKVYVVTRINGSVFGVCSTKARAERTRADFNQFQDRRESSVFIESHEIDERFTAIERRAKLAVGEY